MKSIYNLSAIIMSVVLLSACTNNTGSSFPGSNFLFKDKTTPLLTGSLLPLEHEEQGSESRSLKTKRNRAHAYHFGIGAPKNHMKAQDYYEAILEGHEDTRTMNDYAALLLNGDTRVQDPQYAIRLLKTATEMDNASARFNLALLTYNGQYGLTRNPAKAIDMMALSANQGNEKAQAFLVDWVQNESEIPASENPVLREKFMAWSDNGNLPYWRLSAISSNYDRLWDRYFSMDIQDRSVMKSDILALESGCDECISDDDDVVARKLMEIENWRADAKKDDRAAVFNLGKAYLSGDGVPVNREKGARMIWSSAQDGYVPAQYQLGKIFLNGIGVKRDAVAAYGWFNIAATDSWGYRESQWAAEMRDWFTKYMPQKDVERGQVWSTHWLSEQSSE